ncbi:Hydrogenase maturation factor HypB [subsurface metagenome]
MAEVKVKSKVLIKNDKIADTINSRFRENNIVSLNLIGSPGSGKTTLLEAVLPRIKDSLSFGVIEGDVKTENDMKRIAAFDVPVTQIQTQGSCHLNADMVDAVLDEFSLPELDVMIIENVGNLICPVAYNLGEDYRVVVISVTEGEDKPLKYPSAFISADVLIITKADLAPYVDARIEVLKENAISINPKLTVFITSAKTGEGIDEFIDFLKTDHKR